KHRSHHSHPNDVGRDPNLDHGKAERVYDKFPLRNRSELYGYYWRFFWPPFVLINLVELVKAVSVGTKGQTKYPSVLGLVFLGVMIGLIRGALFFGFSMVGPRGGLLILGLIVIACIPGAHWERRSGRSYSARVSAGLRLCYYWCLIGGLGVKAELTGHDPTLAFFVLWVFPLVYVFPYLMLLREIFQHANAGKGDLDNSRIIDCDALTRWALLGYGNDYHLLHHLFPSVPHYRLRELHERLLRVSPIYREEVEATADLGGSLSVG
ncbi:MAG: fatty acid desaturase, partial [Verrucomicrobiota bacterium]